MVRRGRLAILVGGALVVVGCTTTLTLPSPPPTSPGARPSAPAAGSPSATVSATSSPAGAGPAWEGVLAMIGADGSVSKETALQAFSLAFGPLPGVDLPTGEVGFTRSGSMPLRWLVGYWDELSAAQQQAAIALLPDLAGLAPTGHGIVLASQARPDHFYTQLAQAMVAEIGGHLKPPFSFGLTVEARVGLPVSSTSWAETSVLTKSGGFVGNPEKCSIVVGPKGDALSDVDVRLMMAHEAWHCYEGAVLGLNTFWYQPPAPWIMEGEAEWVGDSLEPIAPIASEAWPGYLPRPDRALFTQAYSAVGFYSQLDSSGTDPWAKLVPILEAADNQAAFNASGANADQFLDRWASGFLRDSSRGDPWQITGPAITGDYAIPTDIQLSNDGSIPESADAYANEIALFGSHPEVLVVTSAGHVRLSDKAGHDYATTEGGNFCMLADGCICPGSQGEPPPLPLEGEPAAFALTGGPAGATAVLDGLSLDDFCNSLTGTWDGTWVNDLIFGDPPATGGFTQHLTQKGKTFSGTVEVTGPTCVTGGTVSGTITGKNLQMGWVTNAERDVNFVGTIGGTTMSGTYSAISCGTTDFIVTGSWTATKRR